MRNTHQKDLQDSRVSEKVALSGLWTTMLFVFAYVDIFGFWRSDVIEGVFAGEVSGTGLVIDQTFLTLATAYVLVPSLMIVVSLLTPARLNRVTNIIVSVIYLVSIVANVIGESWIYYIIGSAVEIVILATITYVAWTWQRVPTPHSPGVTMTPPPEAASAD